jgi:hypothetical protein
MITTFVETPRSNEWTLFGGIPEFKKEILNSNSIRVSVSFHTKTYLNFSLQAGKTRFAYNERSQYSIDNKLTLVEKKDWNMLSGQQTINHYFKLTKKQNIEVMKNHIESLVKQMINDLHIEGLYNEKTFILNIELPSALMEKV